LNEKRYKIHLRTLHKKQQAIKDTIVKRKIIVWGRRAGKTTYNAEEAINGMLEGRRVLEAAPTADQTEAFWKECKRALADLIQDKLIVKNETDRSLDLQNGGRIRCKTAWDADSLRGDYADILILDEFSLMKPSAWDEVGAPMLLDNDGDAIFTFTPKRKNHAYAMYNRALGDLTGRWQAWHGTSFDNVYLSRQALDDIVKDMTEDAYKQEILAEFLENEGAVFRNIPACMLAPLTSPEAHKGHKIVMGVDWGKENDYSAMSVGCAQCRIELARDRSNKVEYILQQQRLATLVKRWGVRTIIPESNSMGSPIIERLRRDPELKGVTILPFETTAVSKPPLIESLALALERSEFQFQADVIWQAELESYEMTQSKTTNRPSYSAPEGCHDDTVIARALMLNGIATGGWARGAAG
jgi:hypothetical protein